MTPGAYVTIVFVRTELKLRPYMHRAGCPTPGLDSTLTRTPRILDLRGVLHAEAPGRRSSAVEQPIRNRQVEGSIPPAGSTHKQLASSN